MVDQMVDLTLIGVVRCGEQVTGTLDLVRTHYTADITSSKYGAKETVCKHRCVGRIDPYTSCVCVCVCAEREGGRERAC